MQQLLWEEESQMAMSLSEYDISQTELRTRPGGSVLWLRVEGLAEKRPSVVIGDRVHVVQEGKHWEGVVHHVERVCI